MKLLGILIINLLLCSSPGFAAENLYSEIQDKDVKSGTPSFNFRYKDSKGKWVELKDFRGKYVYIDIWATWCGPCLAEIPHLKQLEKEMEGRKIVFVSISSDTDKTVWDKFVKEQRLTGVQLWMGKGKDMKDFYNIQFIPRFILLDKKGHIVDADMTRPSDKKTKETLIRLRGI